MQNSTDYWTLRKKEDILFDNAEKYRLMDPKQKQNLQSKKAEKYRSMEPNKKGDTFQQ